MNEIQGKSIDIVREIHLIIFVKTHISTAIHAARCSHQMMHQYKAAQMEELKWSPLPACRSIEEFYNNFFHCLTISYNVFHRLTMSYNFFHCLIMSYNVFNCLTMSCNVFHCLALSYIVFLSLKMSYNIIQCLTMSFKVLQCFPLSYNVLHCLEMSSTASV